MKSMQKQTIGSIATQSNLPKSSIVPIQFRAQTSKYIALQNLFIIHTL